MATLALTTKIEVKLPATEAAQIHGESEKTVDALYRLWAKLESDQGLNQTDESRETTLDQADAIAWEMVSARAQTRHEIALKLRVVLKFLRDGGGFYDDREQAIIHSVIDDLHRLGDLKAGNVSPGGQGCVAISFEVASV